MKTKKKIIIAVFALLLAAGIAGTFWGPDIAEAASPSLWNSCPKGKVNDYYPGDCHDYIDTNKDVICDRSQPDPAAAATPMTTKASPAVPVTITATTTTPAAASTTLPGTTSTNEAGGQGGGSGTGDGTGIGHVGTYNFLPIAIACIVLYLATWILASTKKIKLLTHRKIWNSVLLVTMLISILLGLERIILKDYGADLNLPFNTLFWHVESSIVLGVVAVCHIIWHWRYWVKLFGKKEAKPEGG